MERKEITDGEALRELNASGTEGAERMRILVADDHRVIRAGLRRIMENEGDLDICGEAEDAAGVLRLVRGEKWDGEVPGPEAGAGPGGSHRGERPKRGRRGMRNKAYFSVSP